jgi:hypothetical protein
MMDLVIWLSVGVQTCKLAKAFTSILASADLTASRVRPTLPFHTGKTSQIGKIITHCSRSVRTVPKDRSNAWHCAKFRGLILASMRLHDGREAASLRHDCLER